MHHSGLKILVLAGILFFPLVAHSVPPYDGSGGGGAGAGGGGAARTRSPLYEEITVEEIKGLRAHLEKVEIPPLTPGERSGAPFLVQLRREAIVAKNSVRQILQGLQKGEEHRRDKVVRAVEAFVGAVQRYVGGRGIHGRREKICTQAMNLQEIFLCQEINKDVFRAEERELKQVDQRLAQCLRAIKTVAREERECETSESEGDSEESRRGPRGGSPRGEGEEKTESEGQGIDSSSEQADAEGETTDSTEEEAKVPVAAARRGGMCSRVRKICCRQEESSDEEGEGS